MSKKISYDFDDTLSSGRVQSHAKIMLKEGYEIWIVTARLPDSQAPSDGWNNDLYFVAEQLSIPRERIIFTSYTPKYEFFWERYGDDRFLWHLDDDLDEVEGINAMTKTKGIHFPYGNVKKRLEILNNLK